MSSFSHTSLSDNWYRWNLKTCRT